MRTLCLAPTGRLHAGHNRDLFVVFRASASALAPQLSGNAAPAPETPLPDLPVSEAEASEPQNSDDAAIDADSNGSKRQPSLSIKAVDNDVNAIPDVLQPVIAEASSLAATSDTSDAPTNSMEPAPGPATRLWEAIRSWAQVLGGDEDAPAAEGGETVMEERTPRGYSVKDGVWVVEVENITEEERLARVVAGISGEYAAMEEKAKALRLQMDGEKGRDFESMLKEEEEREEALFVEREKRLPAPRAEARRAARKKRREARVSNAYREWALDFERRHGVFDRLRKVYDAMQNTHGDAAVNWDREYEEKIIQQNHPTLEDLYDMRMEGKIHISNFMDLRALLADKYPQEAHMVEEKMEAYSNQAKRMYADKEVEGESDGDGDGNVSEEVIALYAGYKLLQDDFHMKRRAEERRLFSLPDYPGFRRFWTRKSDELVLRDSTGKIMAHMYDPNEFMVVNFLGIGEQLLDRGLEPNAKWLQNWWAQELPRFRQYVDNRAQAKELSQEAHQSSLMRIISFASKIFGDFEIGKNAEKENEYEHELWSQSPPSTVLADTALPVVDDKLLEASFHLSYDGALVHNNISPCYRLMPACDPSTFRHALHKKCREIGLRCKDVSHITSFEDDDENKAKSKKKK